MALSRTNLSEISPDEVSDQNELTFASSWMSKLPGKLKLFQICIPGTHDSITKMSVHNDFAPAIPLPSWLISVCGKFRFIDKLVKKHIVGWSQAQILSASDQLKHGARYFDLRIAKNEKDNQLYTCHGLYSTDTLQTTLSEINHFLSNNKDEIVILDCASFFLMDSTDHQNLLNLFSSIFLNKIIPSNMGIDVSLDTLRKHSKQVIIIYHDDSIALSKPDLLWRSTNIYSPWPNKTSPESLKTSLDFIVSHPTESKLQVAQAVLTPNTLTIIKGLLLGWLPGSRKWAPNSLLDFAKNLNFIAENWINNDWKNKHLNIIIMDHVEFLGDRFVKATFNHTMENAIKTTSLDTTSLLLDNLDCKLDSSSEHEAELFIDISDVEEESFSLSNSNSLNDDEVTTYGLNKK